jgi:hypothetical protein
MAGLLMVLKRYTLLIQPMYSLILSLRRPSLPLPSLPFDHSPLPPFSFALIHLTPSPRLFYPHHSPKQDADVDLTLNIRDVPPNRRDRKASDFETNPHLKYWDPYANVQGREGDERSSAILNKKGKS